MQTTDLSLACPIDQLQLQERQSRTTYRNWDWNDNRDRCKKTRIHRSQFYKQSNRTMLTYKILKSSWDDLIIFDNKNENIRLDSIWMHTDHSTNSRVQRNAVKICVSRRSAHLRIRCERPDAQDRLHHSVLWKDNRKPSARLFWRCGCQLHRLRTVKVPCCVHN